MFFAGKFHSFNIMLCGVVLFLLHNLIFALEKKTRRMFFLIFNLTVFVFLIVRPFIDMLKGNMWWHFKPVSVNFALNGIMASLIAMFFGAVTMDFFAEKNELNQKNIQKGFIDENFLANLQNISRFLFYLSAVFACAAEVEKLIYMQGRTYAEIYLGYSSALPYFVTVVANMNKYFLCIFLATYPKKRAAFVALAVSLLLTFPDFFIGARGYFVLSLLFILAYYLLRDALGDQKKWLGRFEKIAAIAILPVFMAFLGAYNYIRDGDKVKSTKITELIVDFLHKQGVTFNVLCLGHETIPKIQYTGFVNYTFGGIIDYFKYSKVAQILWSAKPLASGNSLSTALYSNNFAHRMSYIVNSGYLQGHGYGSSYILETYADFGFFGIIIFSFLLGVFLVSFVNISKKSNVGFVFILIVLTKIFYSPRDAALIWLYFIVYLQFWVPLIICFTLANLFIKKYYTSYNISQNLVKI